MFSLAKKLKSDVAKQVEAEDDHLQIIDEAFRLSKPTLSSNMSRLMMETLLQQSNESDIGLFCKTNVRFDVNRHILRMSPYFEAF